jgi:hypothetical protein
MVLAHQDAWRKHPFIANCGKKPFPGLGLATGIFGAYLAVDMLSNSGSNKKAHATHAHAPGNHHESHSPSEYKYIKTEIGERPSLAEE